MEEVIDYVNAQNSPQEWAIHFLLRHAECRMALMDETGDGGQSERAKPASAAAAERRDVTATHKPAGSDAASGLPLRAVAVEESCAARFSRAYAAARHSRAPENTRGAAARTPVRSNPARAMNCTVATA